MTLDELKPFEARMSPRAYELAQALVSGATTIQARDRLRMGSKMFLRLAAEAEAAVGQRLRKRHGGFSQWSSQARARQEQRTAVGRQAVARRGATCPRCGLSLPHACLRGEDFTRSGERAGSVRYGRMLHEE